MCDPYPPINQSFLMVVTTSVGAKSGHKSTVAHGAGMAGSWEGESALLDLISGRHMGAMCNPVAWMSDVLMISQQREVVTLGLSLRGSK